MKQGITHVFFIANPINLIVAKMFIESYGIPPEDTEVITLRASDASLLGGASLAVGESISDRLKMKLLGISGTGLRIRKYLEKTDKNFIVYASWMYPEVEEVSKSEYCNEVIYIEEGQLSYYMAQAYKSHRKNNWAKRKKNILEGSVDYYFRDDYAAFIGMSQNCFPLLNNNKRIVLSNFDAASSSYVERLPDISCIGITPAPRRIPSSAVESLVITFCEAMPAGSVIKLHPGFNVHIELRSKFIETLQRVSKGSISVVEDDIIVELEMLHCTKVLYGCRSSVSRYAKMFGSEYVNIDFDGYIVPKN